MLFWLLMLVIVEIIPFILYKLGKYYLQNPNLDRNARFTIKTKRSTLNDEIWEYTHMLHGSIWTKAGFNLLAIVALSMILVIAQNTHVILITSLGILAFELFILARGFFVIHKNLKRNFDCEGNRLEVEEPVRNKDLYL